MATDTAPAEATENATGADDLVIPAAALASHEGFRRWARSDAFPERGRIDYLGGQVVIDMSPERAFSHGRPKSVIAAAIERLVGTYDLGYVFVGETLVSNREAGLSTEPDVLVVTYDAIESGRCRLIGGSEAKGGDVVEFEGAVDLVVEVVSPSSAAKDTRDLPERHFAAGTVEFWLVDLRGDAVEFAIHRRGHDAFEAVAVDGDGFARSGVLDASFRLASDTDRLGRPKFTLEVAE